MAEPTRRTPKFLAVGHRTIRIAAAQEALSRAAVALVELIGGKMRDDVPECLHYLQLMTLPILAAAATAQVTGCGGDDASPSGAGSHDAGVGGTGGDAATGTGGQAGTGGSGAIGGGVGGAEAGCALTVCNGSCVDTQTDPDNCGACGYSCKAGHDCQAGNCSPCPSGQTLCGSACADTLTDDAHCGGCDQVCAGACDSGHCIIELGGGFVHGAGVAVDANSVYWTDYIEGTVQKIPIAGGPATTLASIQGGPRGIAVDATHVYWASSAGVHRVPVDGGTTSIVGSGNDSFAVAVDGSDVYFTNLGDGTIKQKDLDSSSISTVFASGQGKPRGIAIDATNVYWADSLEGRIMKAPRAGGSPQIVALGQSNPFDVAVDATGVYWTNDLGSSGSVMKAPFGGSITALATKLDGPQRIALDAMHAFWVNYQGGTIMKVPLGGGAVSVVASGQTYLSAIALGPDHVYWVHAGVKQATK